jgi:hypothetical protein
MAVNPPTTDNVRLFFVAGPDDVHSRRSRRTGRRSSGRTRRTTSDPFDDGLMGSTPGSGTTVGRDRQHRRVAPRRGLLQYAVVNAITFLTEQRCDRQGRDRERRH